MASKQLEASIRRRNGVALIDLDGEINAMADEALNTAYQEAAGESPKAILLNFKDVSYINSTGIALIVGVLMQARTSSVPLLTTGLSDHYLEIFEITRLSDYMNIYPDEESALAEASK